MAVSGGRDSVALLHFLARAGWGRLIVCHLNHHLRGRVSDADERFVRELSRRAGLLCEARRVDVRSLARRKKLSLETAGREARRAFFAAMSRRHRCRFLFTAHHANDQAETVLHRLCRGASLAGFGGMPPVAESMEGIVTLRPLLEVTRAEIDAYIATQRLEFREDESNASRRHTRNRVRHEVLPLMDDVFLRDVSPLIVRFAKHAGRDDECLQDITRMFLRKNSLAAPKGALRVTAAFKGLHPAIQSRIVFAWLAKSHRIPAGAKEIDAALAMLRGTGPLKTNLPGGAHLRGDDRRLWVERTRATGRR